MIFLFYYSHGTPTLRGVRAVFSFGIPSTKRHGPVGVGQEEGHENDQGATYDPSHEERLKDLCLLKKEKHQGSPIVAY